MMDSTFSLINRRLIVLLFLISATSCTLIIDPPKEVYKDYVPHKKINLFVGLNITDDLRQTKWKKKQRGDTWIIPIGEWLPPNSLALANNVFYRVIDVSGKSSDPYLSVDAILTPKVAYINRTMGATSFGKSIITVKVEWDLRTLEGFPIWIETISGEASGSSGWSNPENILKQALQNLLINSNNAFSSSPAITQFAESRINQQ